eukprot:3679120-Prymnesium_polylepis.1
MRETKNVFVPSGWGGGATGGRGAWRRRPGVGGYGGGRGGRDDRDQRGAIWAGRPGGAGEEGS